MVECDDVEVALSGHAICQVYPTQRSFNVTELAAEVLVNNEVRATPGAEKVATRSRPQLAPRCPRQQRKPRPAPRSRAPLRLVR
eukprot:3958443-Alexandrium_andersonii.AAC.1